MSRADLRIAIRTERERLVRDLRAVSSEEWERPSLCDGWLVRDVVGHLLRNDEAYRRGYPFLVDLARAGFRPQAALASAARRCSRGRTPGELVDALEKTAYERGVRIHPTPAVPLGELLIHGQDVRRALGRSHDVPPETFCMAADGALAFTRYLFGWGRLPRQVRFEAVDADWSLGTGEAVRGPIEAITMVLAGREAAIADLEGSGGEILRSMMAR